MARYRGPLISNRLCLGVSTGREGQLLVWLPLSIAFVAGLTCNLVRLHRRVDRIFRRNTVQYIH